MSSDALDRYYEGGNSSVYLWDIDEGAWAGVVLFKKGEHPQLFYQTRTNKIQRYPASETRLLTRSFPFATVLSPTSPHSGSYDSIHVFEVRDRGRQSHYSLTSTVLLWINTKATPKSPEQEQDEKDKPMTTGVGDVSLSGSMTRQIEQDLNVGSQSQGGHIPNLGRMIEDME